ncbi:MAG: CARDB domain-containing protein [Candidatus Gracilibacteria bacterium]|nr:CARDB domain-containing protein [Candidatus Gracilibacteria bacterium]
MKAMNSKPNSNKAKSGNKKRLWMLIGVILLGVVALTYGRGELFKGQLMRQDMPESEIVEDTSALLPDLVAKIELVSPPSQGENLKVMATLENLGPGAIDGKKPLEYSIKVNGKEVLATKDSFTSMGKGDLFSFEYEIPRAIYEYKDDGVITFELDPKNLIKEIDEKSNDAEINYEY